MSVSSVGSSSPASYLQRMLQTDGADPSDASAPSDPLQALYQALTGGSSSSSDPLLAAATSSDDSSDSASSSGAPQFSADVMKALLSVQSSQTGGSSKLEQLLGKFDTNGDGTISQSEFENAIGPGADKSKVDQLFAKLDSNSDGAVSQDELQSALQKAHGGGGHHHHHGAGGAGGAGGGGGTDPLEALLSGASSDGTTSQSTTNADGSSSTTITYADGTKVEMTTPASATAGTSTSDSSTANPEAPNFANLLKQLISLQAQLAAPTTSMSV
jgi:Ca2+-binding EF-hand superfamily protein